MLFCLLTALPQSARAKGDSIRTFTVEHPLVYEDSWDLWPYVFLNENGEPDGYNIDLLKLIFKELDMPYIIKLMPTLDAQNDLREGKSDLMLRMDAEFTQGNSIFGNNVVQLFTHSIVTPTDKPVKIENIRSLARYTVIVHEGSFSHYLIKKNKWAKKIEPFDDMKEAIQKVSTLDDGIIVWNTMSLKWLMQKYHTDNLSITPIDLPYGEYKFMSNNPRLLQVIDSVYTSLKANDKLQPIQNKWFYPERTYSGLPGWLTKTAYVFGIMALAVLLYYLVYHFRVRQMTKAVRKRNNRLALILRTGQVTLWTCDVQTSPSRTSLLTTLYITIGQKTYGTCSSPLTILLPGERILPPSTYRYSRKADVQRPITTCCHSPCCAETETDDLRPSSAHAATSLRNCFAN